MGRRIKIFESFRQRTVYSRHRQRIAEFLAPWLGLRVLQQFDDGMGGHKVLTGKPGAVVENVVIARDTRGVEKSPQDFESRLHGSSRSFLASQQAKQNLSMQV